MNGLQTNSLIQLQQKGPTQISAHVMAYLYNHGSWLIVAHNLIFSGGKKKHKQTKQNKPKQKEKCVTVPEA